MGGNEANVDVCGIVSIDTLFLSFLIAQDS